MVILLDDKGKLCTGDFYCHACNVGNATKESMKMYIERFRKERNSSKELFHALIDKETFTKILKQGVEAYEASEYIRTYLGENLNFITNYFMRLKDMVDKEELRFY
jgi:hypothetical protein